MHVASFLSLLSGGSRIPRYRSLRFFPEWKQVLGLTSEKRLLFPFQSCLLIFGFYSVTCMGALQNITSLLKTLKKNKKAFPQFLCSRRFLFSKTVLSFVFYTKGSQAVAEFWGFLRAWLLLCGWLGALSDEWGSPCWVTSGRHFLLPQLGPVTNLIRQVPDSVTLGSLLNQDPKVS